MSTTGLPVFDTTLQETNLWLKSLMARLGSEDRYQAYVILKAVLHALRDRMGPENAVHFGAQLPMLVRGFYYEGWRIAATPTKERHVQAFLEHIRAGVPKGTAIDVEKGARAVFEVLWEKVDRGEVNKILKILPQELGGLFPPIARESE